MTSLNFRAAFVLAIFLVPGCPHVPKAPEPHISTQFVLRDKSILYGDLMGVLQDSVIVQDAYYFRFTALHFEDLRAVRIEKPGSPVLKGVGSALGGAGLGGLVGCGLGELISIKGPGHNPTARALFIGTVSIGLIGGAIIGVVSAHDREIVIEQKSDLLGLESFARFSNEEDLRNYRGY
jgi:hypothetical protein